jgi:uncharacterized glyoxalase superfamily protein PhnB
VKHVEAGGNHFLTKLSSVVYFFRKMESDLMYESVTVNIMVENVCETINFYQRLLGFEKIITVPDEGKELEFALLKKDSMQIMFQSKESITQEYPSLETNEIKPMFTLYIMVTEIEKLYNELKETLKSFTMS